TSANCLLHRRGAAVAGILKDIDAEVRDETKPTIGADEVTALLGAGLANVAAISDSAVYAVNSGGTVYLTAGCDRIAKVVPSGAAAASGSLKVKVTGDFAVQSFNAAPYVQRHYDIEPANN